MKNTNQEKIGQVPKILLILLFVSIAICVGVVSIVGTQQAAASESVTFYDSSYEVNEWYVYDDYEIIPFGNNPDLSKTTQQACQEELLL